MSYFDGEAILTLDLDGPWGFFNYFEWVEPDGLIGGTIRK